MVICRYYKAGRCRYGDSCKYEHIDSPEGARNNEVKDPFSTPNKQDKNRSNKTSDPEPQWPLTVVGIKENLQQGNELSGDMSPEELRAAAYSMAPRGLSNEVTQREERLLSDHRVKYNALNRSTARQQTPAGRVTQPQDPFAPNGSGAAQQGFAQPFQQPPLSQASQGGSAFGQTQPFGAPSQPPQSFSQPQQGFSNPQEPAPSQNTQTPLSSTSQEQFTAAQFGFAKVPESAPPPQFY